jgi:FlaA1/EpsC-like NDP-sugar epimerase
MEEDLGENRPRNYEIPKPQETMEEVDTEMSLKKKRVLVVFANGRLGSMVCKSLLRNNPQTEVVANETIAYPMLYYK